MKPTVSPGFKPCEGCGNLMQAMFIACRRCWLRAPKPLRDSVIRNAGRDLLAAASSIRELLAWLREHPVKHAQ